MVSASRVTLRRRESRVEIGDLQLLRRGLAAAQKRPDASQEFYKCEGLGEVIVRAEFQAFDAIVHRSTGAQDQNRRPDFARPDTLQHLHAVHIGQHEIENHQVIIGVVNVADGGLSVVGDIDSVAVAFQAALQEIGDLLFVLNDQNPHAGYRVQQ